MKLKLPPSKWLIWLNGIVMAKSYFINLNFPEVAGDFSLPKSYLNLGAKKVVWRRCNLTKLCFWCFVDILRKHIQWQLRAIFGTSDQPLWRRSLELSWSNPGRKNRDSSEMVVCNNPHPGSLRPNKEWSLGWSMDSGFPTNKWASRLVGLDFLGPYNL